LINLQLKATFDVQEEGYDKLEDEESDNLMRDFVDYVKKSKVRQGYSVLDSNN
jgi:hypothetical protein